jgi:hypothetical protein
MLRRGIEQKMEDVPTEDQFGFRKEQGNRGTSWMMRIISKRTLGHR